MSRNTLWVLGLWAAGCRTDIEIGHVDPPDPLYEARLVLDRGAVTAGTAVGFTVEVTDHGVPVDGAHVSLDSDLEDYLQQSTDTVTPIVVGTHTITALVDVEGWSGAAQAVLDVSAGAPYDLDLVLSDAAFVAGGEITWSVFAVDRFGNALDTSGVTVVLDTLDLEVDGNTISGTTPGTYLASAWLGDLEDVEPFVVEPGPPAFIDLTLSRTDLELLETTTANVAISDEFGNETWAPWTLTTDRPDATLISGRNISFFQEGWHTVTATVDGTSLTDSEGPFLIDSTGPEVTVTWPSRGQWSAQYQETVRGAITDAWSSFELEINGTLVPVQPDGSYAHPTTFPWGVDVVDIVATDAGGESTSDSRAVLTGQFLPYGQRCSQGLQARLNEGIGGLGTLEAIGEDVIDGTDLGALIPNPVYSNRSESCTGGGCLVGCPWGGCCIPNPRICVEWYKVDLRVTNPRIGASDLIIDPRADGTLLLRTVVASPHLDFNASGKVIGISYSTSGSIDASSIVVDVVVRPTVSNGTIQMPLVSTNVQMNGFSFNYATWLQDVLNFFGFDARAYIQGKMEDAIEDVVNDEIPPMLAESLNDLELAYNFAFSGRTFTLDAQPASMGVDDVGVTVGMGTILTVDRRTHAGAGLGSLYGQASPPAWSSNPKMNVAFSLDFLNQLTYGLWQGGVLDLETTLDELGVASDDLSMIFPASGQIYATVNPLLPPVVVPGTGPAPYDLQLGDLELTLYDGPVANQDVLLQVYVSVNADFSLSNVGDDRLSASIGATEFSFTVTVPEGNTTAAADTEALLGALMPLLLPRITGAFSQIEVPSIAGFGIRDLSVRATGQNGAWLSLGGNLYEQ
jgi:hypothetical protein